MQVGKCLTRSSKQQRLKYLSTDNDSRSSWELLIISVESRVKYRPGVLTAFDTNSTLRVLSDGAWIRWKCLVAWPGVWPSATHFSKYLVKASYSFFKLRKNLSNVEKVKLFKPVDMFIDWDQGLHEWFWTQGRQKWGACILCSDCRISGGRGQAEHLVITIPCPHHDYIDFLLLPWHWRGLWSLPQPARAPH